MTSIEVDAFSDCPIESATMPTIAIAYIPKSALKTVVITSGTSIGEDAFDGCSKLTSVTIGNSVTSIGKSAFAYCGGLTSVTIPDSVTSIGGSAFSGCDGLTSITIGKGVTSIGVYVFSYCNKLTSITVADGNQVYHGDGNCIIETASKTLVAGCKTSVIPSDESVTVIGVGAFAFCVGLTSITIPNSVTSIGENALFRCSGLTSITFDGTIAQWEAIRKGSSWDYDTDSYVVHCTDGDIAKSQS